MMHLTGIVMSEMCPGACQAAVGTRQIEGGMASWLGAPPSLLEFMVAHPGGTCHGHASPCNSLSDRRGPAAHSTA